MDIKIDACGEKRGKKNKFQVLAAVFWVLFLLISVAGCGSGGSGHDAGTEGSTDSGTDTGNDSDNQGGGTIISETTRMSELTIADGEMLAAPDGYSLTMTVDGVETPMDPGTYTGDIVLTVTEEIVVTYGNLDPHYFRTAVYIEDGAYVAEKSVSAAVAEGNVTDASATDVSITSTGESFNGIMVTGDSIYNVTNPFIDFTGNGDNDFAGFGAALMSKGTADLTVNNAEILTDGVVRTAVWVGGSSTMTVNDSYIEVNNGTLQDDYTFTIEMGKMKEVPWMLGLTGNCRATLVVGNGTAFYNNTHLIAEGWGVLSTDDVDSCDLTATGCTIETVESGYGAYSIGDCLDYFDNCIFNVTDIGLIMASNGSGTFTNGTEVNSGRFGVMMHSGSGGTLTIDNGSEFNTGSTVIQVKGRGADIVVDDAQLNSGNGIILQAMENDDPYAGGGTGGGNDVVTTFSNMTLSGDIVNSRTSGCDLSVAFENATITGAITQAVATSVGSASQEHPELIGEVTNEYQATDCDVAVTLDGTSSWTVDTTSYLTGLTIESGATVTAPAGHAVTMTVNGTPMAIVAGTYSGDIVLAVN